MWFSRFPLKVRRSVADPCPASLISLSALCIKGGRKIIWQSIWSQSWSTNKIFSTLTCPVDFSQTWNSKLISTFVPLKHNNALICFSSSLFESFYHLGFISHLSGLSDNTRETEICISSTVCHWRSAFCPPEGARPPAVWGRGSVSPGLVSVSILNLQHNTNLLISYEALYCEYLTW